MWQGDMYPESNGFKLKDNFYPFGFSGLVWYSNNNNLLKAKSRNTS